MGKVGTNGLNTLEVCDSLLMICSLNVDFCSFMDVRWLLKNCTMSACLKNGMMDFFINEILVGQSQFMSSSVQHNQSVSDIVSLLQFSSLPPLLHLCSRCLLEGKDVDAASIRTCGQKWGCSAVTLACRVTQWLRWKSETRRRWKISNRRRRRQ